MRETISTCKVRVIANSISRAHPRMKKPQTEANSPPSRKENATVAPGSCRSALVVEDETLFRYFLVTMLKEKLGFEKVIEAQDGAEALEKFEAEEPDLAVIDLRLPGMNGDDLASRLLERRPDTKILILSAVDDSSLIGDLLKQGVRGFLHKQEELSLFEDAIRAVAGDRIFVSAPAPRGTPSVSFKLEQSESLESLTKRELQILKLIASGKTNKDIAAQLYLSRKTIEAHRSKITKKLKIHNIAGLTRFAARTGLINF